MKLILVSGLILLLVSCQKEVNFDNQGNGNGIVPPAVVLLTKVYTDYGRNQLGLVYLYDAKNRVIRMNQVRTSQGSLPKESHTILVRNTDGIVTKAISSGVGYSDSILITLNYNTVTGKYISSFSKGAVSNLLNDSIVYFYDAQGKIAERDVYISSPSVGTSLILGGKEFYTHDAAGNIKSIKSVYFDYLTGLEEVTGEYIYTYDSSINPLVLPVGEAMLIGDISMTSPNNVIKMEYKDFLSTGTVSFFWDAGYTYNSKNKPVTSSVKESNGVSYNKTYTYK